MCVKLLAVFSEFSQKHVNREWEKIDFHVRVTRNFCLTHLLRISKILPGNLSRQCDVRLSLYLSWLLWLLLLPSGAFQQGGVLFIPNCRPDYSGRYVCTITAVTGVSNTGHTNLVVTGSPPGPQGRMPVDITIVVRTVHVWDSRRFYTQKWSGNIMVNI